MSQTSSNAVSLRSSRAFTRARGLGFANEIMRYLVEGKGMMTFGASLCAASVRVLDRVGYSGRAMRLRAGEL